MIGKIFITSKGYDPEVGKHVKDPYLGDCPTLGGCRPDIRKQLSKGDHIFVISGQVTRANQFILGGFEISEKISCVEAYHRFPEQRLRKRQDGQLTGNVIVDAAGRQHPLDGHKTKTFGKRIENYVVGKDLLSLTTPQEIAEGREQTVAILSEILQIKGKTPFSIVGRYGKKLTEQQILQLRSWFEAVKKSCEN